MSTDICAKCQLGFDDQKRALKDWFSNGKDEIWTLLLDKDEVETVWAWRDEEEEDEAFNQRTDKRLDCTVSLVACVEGQYIGTFAVDGSRLNLRCAQVGTQIRDILLHAPWYQKMQTEKTEGVEYWKQQVGSLSMSLQRLKIQEEKAKTKHTPPHHGRRGKNWGRILRSHSSKRLARV